MGTSIKQKLETLATTDINEFVELFLSQAQDYEKRISLECTAESICSLSSIYETHGFALFEVYSIGGHEGEGDAVVRVFEIRKNVTSVKQNLYENDPYVEITDGKTVGYFKVTGFYSSYDGIEWDNNFTIVFPRQVQITEYHESKE